MLIDRLNLGLATDEWLIGIWEECWERILQLTHEALFESELCVEAARLVHVYRSPMTDRTIDWLGEWVSDAQQYVSEQLEINPNETAWRRLDAVLVGAHVGIYRELDFSVSRYIH